MSTSSTPPTAVWCPEQQIYIGGVPGASNEQVEALLEANQGALYVFGYGSLCWNPGSPDEALGHPDVVASAGRAMGYQRCWAQKSTDHRGRVSFPGIVCTLLQQQEVEGIVGKKKDPSSTKEVVAATEGMIYRVPPSLARDCLAELDFREKGGYAREIIEVVEDESGQTLRALLYRGTPDNPAFWPRVVWDLPLAAAVMAVSEGPSGPNHVYLNMLDQFLQQTTTGTHTGDDTCSLASMTKELQQHDLYFLYGCGSNQHGQIVNWHNDGKDEDFSRLEESVLCCPRTATQTQVVDPPQRLYAGGGHSGLLTQSGRLYLWGWNEQGQCGPQNTESAESSPLPLVQPSLPFAVQEASLGFAHTLAIAKETQQLWGLGDNGQGQVISDSHEKTISTPTLLYPDDQFVAVAAGVFHSAAITTQGELITWGSSNHGQCLHASSSKWKPDDGGRLVDVVCGKHHTAVVDDRGRIWTMGDHQHGALGRSVTIVEEEEASKKKKRKTKAIDPVPRLVDGPLGMPDDNRSVQLESGWSHLVTRVVSSSSSNSTPEIYGWGRNDKGQLGACFAEEKAVTSPRLMEDPLLVSNNIARVSCGSESTYFLDESKMIYSCGWNEHGNLGVDDTNETVGQIKPVVDTARIVSPPTYSVGKDRRMIMAAGGAHLLALVT